MTKEDILDYLTKNGASSSLINKPAVMERIYACFDIDSTYGLITGSLYEIQDELQNAINIDADGNITLSSGTNKRKFKKAPNNKVLYINNDESGYSIDELGEYLIDKYGMDRSYSNGEDFSVSRESDGTVSINGLKVEDNGSPILNPFDLTNGDNEKSWKKNREYISNTYPEVKKWYEEKESQLDTDKEKTSRTEPDIEPESNEQLQDEIKRLKAENSSLREENQSLKQTTIPKTEADSIRTEKRRLEIERNILKTQNEEQKSSYSDLSKQFQEQKMQNTKLQAENEQQKQEIQGLMARNQNLQRMLKQTLDFCESVRNSFLGRFFFGSKLKQLPEGTQTQEQKNSGSKQEEQVR